MSAPKPEVVTPTLLLGIDGGGTKTVAWLAEHRAEQGAVVVGKGASGPSNPRDVGLEVAQRTIEAAKAEALSDAGLNSVPIAVAVMAIAGAADGVPRTQLRDWAVVSGLALRCDVVADAEPVIAAGTPDGWGIALIAGTGSFAYGRDSAGRVATAGGYGYLLGDEGSGFWLGQQALRAIVRQLEGKGPAIALAGALTGNTDSGSLKQAVYKHGASRQTISALAPLIAQTAEQGDTTARNLMVTGADELAQLVASVATQIGLTEYDFPLAMAGGLLVQSQLMRDLLIGKLTAKRLRANPQTIVPEPVAGCIALAEKIALQR